MPVAFHHSGGAWFDAPGAACRGLDPELFFPERDDHARIADAKAVCAGCVERDACLAFAVEHHQPGVWGGTTVGERNRLRRAARRGTV